MPRSAISKLKTPFQSSVHTGTAVHVIFWVFWFLPLYLAFQLAAQWPYGLLDTLLIPYSLASSILVWRTAARSTVKRWASIAYKTVTGLWLLILIPAVGCNLYFIYS